MTTFPTSLQDLDATRGTSSQALNNPSHADHHALEDDTIEAIQTKLGVNNSAVATTIDYLLKSTSSVSPGHKHVSSEITDLTPISSSTGVADGGKLIKTNFSGVLDQSFTTAPIVRTYLNAASPATWTKPTGLKYVVVETQGSGGGGGGTSTTDTGGGGGGGGGYARKLIAAAALGATETVTIAAGGSAGGDGGTDGGNGGTSSFGTHCTGTGGGGGKGTAANGGAGSTSPGAGTGGDFNIVGGCGQSGGATNAGGNGGSSVLGGGGGGGRANSNVAGIVGGVYGGGGGGANSSSGDSAGGAGAAGIVIVTEYYN